MKAVESGPARAASIREHNERLVLRLVSRSEVLSQSEAVAQTGLKPPTIFRIFAELEKRGLIAADAAHRREDESDRKGRRPLFYRVVPEAGYFVGVDFWAGSAAAVVQDFAAGLAASKATTFPVPPDADAALKVVIGLVSDVLSEAGISADQVLGIGVGAPGSVSVEDGSVLFYSRIAGMSGFPLGERLAAAFGTPVHVHNNASVVAIAEHRYGPARGAASLFAFLLRSGLGGAFLQDGVPLVNRGRTAFEVGHLSVDMNGPPCTCGNRGCLENFLCEEAILRAAGAGLDIARLDALIEARDAATLKALEPTMSIAAAAVRNVRRILAPEAVLVVTRSAALSALLAAAADEDEARVDDRFGPRGARVLAAAYDPLMACRAACDLACEAFFSGKG